MKASEFVNILAAHGFKAKAHGASQWEARCPAHEDRRASLSIGEGSDGKVIMHCHAGCTAEAVCGAVGVKVADLFPQEKRNGKPRGEIVATYDYTDEAGELLYQVVRREPKDFRQRKPDPHAVDGWSWSVKGVRRVPFRLPQVIAAVKDGRPIFVCEGEKDVLAIEASGFCATCNPGGAGKWPPEFADVFTGAEVVILPDRDEPGRKHGQQVADNLRPVAKSVRVVELPDVGGKPVKDPADYFAAGGQAADLDELAQEAEDKPEPPPSVPTPRPLLSLKAAPIGADPDELLRHRFLCRGGGLLLCGPTGVGKSAICAQAMLLWALGRPAFGIEPARPLKSLLIQSENDDGDMAEFKDGVLAGLGLDSREIEEATNRVMFVREDVRFGQALIAEVLRPLLADIRPDLLWLDPMHAYHGGDASSQRDVSGFLRNGLNPVLTEFRCGFVGLHHTNKPPSGKEKPDWQAGDFAYLGAGSAEWANWSRAVLALRSIGSHDVFELRAGKRGNRLRWQDDQGARSYVKYLAHATEPGVICWSEVSQDSLGRRGRPAAVDPEDMLGLLPPEGLATAAWQETAATENGISRATFYRAKKEFERDGLVVKDPITKQWKRAFKK
ncbi:MAG: AAA family ATPase [Verrucomicrobiales bacterium]|nr:AAA family ATPase [Verrucomicrobiales bacterium]